MKKFTIKDEVQPLPKDKPATYGDENQIAKKREGTSGTRHDKGATKVTSNRDNPQKVREKLEYDHKKKERDPGMTDR